MYVWLKLILLDQLSGLRTFYKATNGDQWRDKSNWDKEDPCQFYGIKCSSDSVITEIDLYANNVVGKFPTDDQDIIQLFDQLQYLSLSYNNGLQGLLPSMKSLIKIDISDTQLQFNFEDIPSVRQLSLNYLNFSGTKFPILLDNLDSLSMMGCGFVFPEQNASLSRFSSLRWADNDMSQVTAIDFPKLTTYDLAGTQIRGIFDFSIVTNPVEIIFADTQLVIKKFRIDVNTTVVDCSNVVFEGLEPQYDQWAQFSKLTILNLRNASVQGMAPTLEQVEKFYALPNLMILDLSRNPLLCNPNSDDVFDCMILTVENANLTSAQLWLSYIPDLSLGVPRLRQTFTLVKRNTTASNQSNIVTNKIYSCDTFWDNFTMRCALSVADMTVYPRDQLMILYFDSVVSSGHIKVQEDINEQLNAVKADFGKTYSQRKRSRKSSYSDLLTSNNIRSKPVKQQEKLIKIEDLGVSRCPDCTGFFQTVMEPFFIKYPEIAQYIDFEFVSMARYIPSHASKSHAMHGQAESLVDIYMLCLQKIDHVAFFAFSCCFNSDRRMTPRSCLLEAVPHYYFSVMECFDNDAEELLAKSAKRSLEMGVAAAPSIFVQDSLFCQWNQGYDDMNQELCGFADVEGFKVKICSYPEMNGKC